MIARGVKVQLLVFGLVTLLTLWYGATSLLDVGKVVNPPYTVKAVFASPGGIYPRADVDLLGTRVGEVDSVEAGPGTATTVGACQDFCVSDRSVDFDRCYRWGLMRSG